MHTDNDLDIAKKMSSNGLKVYLKGEHKMWDSILEKRILCNYISQEYAIADDRQKNYVYSKLFSAGFSCASKHLSLAHNLLNVNYLHFLQAMASELNMYEAQVQEYKYEIERLARELQEAKKKYFMQKKKEQQQK